MSFSFKPTLGTEIKENTGATPLPEGGVDSVPTALVTPPQTSGSLSYDSRFSSNGGGIIQLILFGVFGLCIISIVFLFGYQQYLTSQINNKKAQLATEEATLGTLPLDGMRKLSNRIKVVNQLIKEHSSVRVAFRIIEDSIENPVTYKSFDLHFSDNDHSYQLNMGAVAADYHSVIQQMDTLKSKTYAKYISSISIEGLHPDDTGKVSFSVKMPIMITGLLPEEVLPASGDIQSSSTPVTTIETSSSTSPVISISTSTPVAQVTGIPKKP